jgi:hypothetical protein
MTLKTIWKCYAILALMGILFSAQTFVRIPLIPPLDSEGIRHPVPIQVARVFRLIPPPLVGA